MEKTVIIDGKQVRFKATGGLGYRYKAQFGRELIQDLIAIEQATLTVDATKLLGKKSKEARELAVAYAMTGQALEMIYNVLWCMAKAADETIPDPQTWLDSFETFDVWDIWSELEDIAGVNMAISPKNA